MDLLELRQQAEESAKQRGHSLRKWATIHGEIRSVANSQCEFCGAWVQCNTKPLPNGIDISGPAVATQCDPFD